MQPQTIERRVERLELRIAELEQLPTCIETLTKRLDGMTTSVAPPTTELHTTATSANAVLARIDELRNELRHEIRAGDEDTRRFVRDLHEDLIRRIGAMADGR